MQLLGRLVSGLLESGCEAAATEMLSSIPEIQATHICDYIVNTSVSVRSLQCIIAFIGGLENLTSDQKIKYSLLDAGIQMYLHLPPQDKVKFKFCVQF